MEQISKLIPPEGVRLTQYTGKEFISRLGQEVINEVVKSILCGENVRDLTEGLTQRRILLLNASLLVTYIRASSSIEDLSTKLNGLIISELGRKIDKNKKIYLKWFLGVTGKGIQNVLRGSDGYLKYLNDLDENLKQINSEVVKTYGELDFNLEFEGKKILLQWPSILRCLFAIGSQTLSIRGSEKSMYGKMFEKLTLGSVLTILGFRHIDPNQCSDSEMVFWLSERKDKRESDATILIRPGVGVRFDIGFIGVGNSEISLDKVSRFEREMDFGRKTHHISTIILVDRIGDNSRIVELAKKIDGVIIQMSMAFWVRELARTLFTKCRFRHEIISMDDDRCIKYIQEKIVTVDLSRFV